MSIKRNYEGTIDQHMDDYLYYYHHEKKEECPAKRVELKGLKECSLRLLKEACIRWSVICGRTVSKWKV